MIRSLGLVTIFVLLSCVSARVEPSAAASSRAVVEHLFAAFNHHDIEAMSELYAPDAIHISPDLCEPRRSWARISPIYEMLFATIPDLHDDIQQVVVEGDSTAVYFVGRSEARGLELPIVALIDVRQGHIVRERTFYNTGRRDCD